MLGTIGYERATIEDFVATLEIAGIELLVDIRERAQSRRAGFSKNALSAALHKAGIGYVHLPELGDPKEGRDAARAGNMLLFNKIYRSVLLTSQAKLALDSVERWASEKSICLMCFERDQRDCHRKIVADDLEVRLSTKAKHLGVVSGAAYGGKSRRMLHPDQSAAASL